MGMVRPVKTHDRRLCQEGWRSLCQIVVRWDLLFFGACHFFSIKTVDLATIYLFSWSARQLVLKLYAWQTDTALHIYIFLHAFHYTADTCSKRGLSKNGSK